MPGITQALNEAASTKRNNSSRREGKGEREEGEKRAVAVLSGFPTQLGAKTGISGIFAQSCSTFPHKIATAPQEVQPAAP